MIGSLVAIRCDLVRVLMVGRGRRRRWIQVLVLFELVLVQSPPPGMM